jgi:hypothetical protein
MEFIKELIQIQHKCTLELIANKLYDDDEDKQNYIQHYNKKNYCGIHCCNCQMKPPRVKIDKLLSNLKT